MRKRFGHSLLMSAVLIGLILVSWCAAKEEEGKQRLPKAPDFQIKDLEGKRVALGDLLGQGPVLISFWATWCKPCLKELPHLQELYEQHKERGLKVVAISEDAPRSLSKVKSFVKGHRYTFLVLLDDNYSTQRKFNFRALPFTVLLDKEGHMVYKRMGYRPGDEQVLAEKIAPLIEAEEREERGEGGSEGEEEAGGEKGAQVIGAEKGAGEGGSGEGLEEREKGGQEEVKKEGSDRQAKEGCEN